MSEVSTHWDRVGKDLLAIADKKMRWIPSEQIKHFASGKQALITGIGEIIDEKGCDMIISFLAEMEKAMKS